MKAIVTGGCGFIGGHLVDGLLAEGWSVSVIDDRSADNDQFHEGKGASQQRFSITDFGRLVDHVKGADVVFHLAAMSRVMTCENDPQEAARVNYLGTCNVLEAARRGGVKRVIYSSTSSAYGLKNPIPADEEMKPDCLGPYAATKVAAEGLCKIYSELWGLDTAVLRYFNVYGERQPTKGQYAPVTGLFERQAENGGPLTVVGDGRQTRDFVHVMDVVRANMAVGQSSRDFGGEVFNIGTGQAYSVMQLAAIIGKGIPIDFLPRRNGEARDTLADTTKAKEAFGFEPKTNLLEWLEK